MVLIEPPEGYVIPSVDDTTLDGQNEEASTAEAEVGQHQELNETTESNLQTPAPEVINSGGLGWYPLAFAGVGTLLLAATVGWFSWKKPPVISQVEPAETRVTDVPDVFAEPVEDSEAEAPNPGLPEPMPDEELERESETSIAPIASEEIDPFEEADAAENDIQAAEPHRVAPEPELPREEAPNRLAQLVNLLDRRPEDSSVEEDSPPKEPNDSAFQASNVTERPNVRNRAKQSIRQVSFQGVALVDFLRSMSLLANIPIHLDPNALEISSSVATTPVSVKGQNETVIEILEGALEPCRLQPTLSDHSISITSERLEDTKVHDTKLFVGDLLAEGFDCAHFVSTLVQPQLWGSGDGGGQIRLIGEQLHLLNQRPVNIQVAIFLERLRQARSLPAKMRLPSHLTTVRPRWKGVEPKLKQPIDVHQWGESTFIEVLSEIESRASLRVVVDWDALSVIGVLPQTSATLYVRNEPAETAIEQLLQSRKLQEDWGIYPIDANTIHLTNRRTVATMLFVEFYQFERLQEASQLVVEQLMLRGQAAIDPVSGIAIVVANSDVHRSLSQ